jgi:ribonuclease BN (tRNA processing enzyme)
MVRERIMLTVTFLGVGSAFAKRNFNANLFFEYWEKGWKGTTPPRPPDDTLLVDFGATGPAALYVLKDKNGFAHLRTDRGMIYYPAIRKVFVSHQHADHIGGLEEMALMNTFVYQNPKTGKPFKAELISTINILVNLWDHSLKGGLNTVPNRYALLQDYFFIRPLIPNRTDKNHFNVGCYKFEIFPTDHIHIERKYDWPSYGLFISQPKVNQAVFYSGDTRFDYPAYQRMMEAAHLCFHDCQFFDQDEGVHATLNELRTLPPEIRAKTLLYHFGDNFDDPALQPAIGEFKGLTKPHKRYVLFSGR